MDNTHKKFGETFFESLEANSYLVELYDNLLCAYGQKTLDLEVDESVLHPQKLHDLLRFADLLSKSNDPSRSEHHKMWAQEIIVLLNFLAPNNSEIRAFAGSVFSNTNNTRAIDLLKTSFSGTDSLDRMYIDLRTEYLKIPADATKQFFAAQKHVYDHLVDNHFSYSAPTSMGKSFLMRMFIKEQIQNEKKLNFALIVPTKALINEVSQKIIRDDLKDLLQRNDYKVITASSDIALESEHNFIMVLTPERLLYLLIAHPELRIDYLFIDEAHKLSGQNSRAPFYYKTVDLLNRRKNPPKFIFASPNVPNPEVYLRLLADESIGKESALRSVFSPVTQVTFMLDFESKEVWLYNSHKRCATSPIARLSENLTLNDLLGVFASRNFHTKSDEKQQTIIYYNSKNKAVHAARDFAKHFNELRDKDLDSLSHEIATSVHEDYFLASMIRKGIAYHIGYLPSAIRMQIEELFKQGKITTLFCTSTLLEGVNLPADNLFITEKKIGRSRMTPVDFKNLIGRVGRIEYNLYGNVFFVADPNSKTTEDGFVKLLQTDIPEQYLSVDAGSGVLKKKERERIVETLKTGSVQFTKEGSPNEASYEMSRRFGLILANDIVTNHSSRVRKSFADLLTPVIEETIREELKKNNYFPDDDINISSDQTERLFAAIRNGLEYPKLARGRFNFEDVLAFLERLCDIFNWEQYERSTLGKVTNESHLKLRWYAVLLTQWMSGYGLNNMIKRGIKYREDHPTPFWVNRCQTDTYKGTLEHKNIVFSDTLEVIENIILFSLSNYFLKFSNVYKQVHKITSFENDWYEFVEYGTIKPETIFLQRIGFSREVATYIRAHEEYLTHDANGQLRLSLYLFRCTNKSVLNELHNVFLNMPEMFETF